METKNHAKICSSRGNFNNKPSPDLIRRKLMAPFWTKVGKLCCLWRVSFDFAGGLPVRQKQRPRRVYCIYKAAEYGWCGNLVSLFISLFFFKTFGDQRDSKDRLVHGNENRIFQMFTLFLQSWTLENHVYFLSFPSPFRSFLKITA